MGPRCCRSIAWPPCRHWVWCHYTICHSSTSAASVLDASPHRHSHCPTNHSPNLEAQFASLVACLIPPFFLTAFFHSFILSLLPSSLSSFLPSFLLFSFFCSAARSISCLLHHLLARYLARSISCSLNLLLAQSHARSIAHIFFSFFFLSNG